MKQKYAKIIDGRVDAVSFEANTLSDGYIEIDSNVFADMVLQDDGSYDYTDEFKTEHQPAETYADRRRKEYPNHEDCIHALLDGGDTLTDLQTKRTTIKEKYPKE